MCQSQLCIMWQSEDWFQLHKLRCYFQLYKYFQFLFNKHSFQSHTETLRTTEADFYLHQRDYVIVVVCLSVCLLATLC